jgi:hypothetical protein
MAAYLGTGEIAYGWKRALLVLVLFDLLFMPYLRLFVIPASLFLVTFACLALNPRLDGDFLLFFAIATVAFLSAAVGGGAGKSVDMGQDLLRAGQLATSFLYYFCFRAAGLRAQEAPSPLLNAFLAFQVFLIGMMLFDFTLFMSYRGHFANTLITLDDISFEAARYTYFFADPNTGAYFFLIVYAFWLQHTTQHPAVRIAGFLACAAVLMAANSRGALVALALCVALLAAQGRSGQLGVLVRRYWIVAPTFVAALFGAIAVFGLGALAEPLALALNVFGDRAVHGSYVEDPRLIIWTRVLNEQTLYPLGVGYSAVLGPHSDHLRFLFSYGPIAYLAFLAFAFRNIFQRGYLFLIPAFIAFSLNSMIDEQKLFAVTLIFLALARNRDEA